MCFMLIVERLSHNSPTMTMYRGFLSRNCASPAGPWWLALFSFRFEVNLPRASASRLWSFGRAFLSSLLGPLWTWSFWGRDEGSKLFWVEALRGEDSRVLFVEYFDTPPSSSPLAPLFPTFGPLHPIRGALERPLKSSSNALCMFVIVSSIRKLLVLSSFIFSLYSRVRELELIEQTHFSFFGQWCEVPGSPSLGGCGGLIGDGAPSLCTPPPSSGMMEAIAPSR
uniref:Uncharacterized protein n=1 Tax=Cannabis sativa TaxID=3483 RepID=A0A803QPT9_CANSA